MPPAQQSGAIMDQGELGPLNDKEHCFWDAVSGFTHIHIPKLEMVLFDRRE
jgi:hypothetical protein